MAARAIDLLIVAELNPDVVVATDAPVRFGQVEQLVERADLTLGSSGAITASAAAAQGLAVTLVGAVGDDPTGEFTVQLLRRRGVDTAAVVRLPDRATGMTIVLRRSDGDRAMLTFPGTMAELTAAAVSPATIAAARHVHVSSIFLQDALRPGLRGLLAGARAAGATTSLDPGWDPAERWTAPLQLLPLLDHFLPNAAEACAIAGALAGAPVDDPVDAARMLAALGPTVVVKDGARGAVGCAGDVVTVAAGVPVAAADLVDTTGAGDNFDACYLAAVLDGASLPQALARAVAGGAVSVRGFGGTGRHPSAAECLAGAEHVAVHTLTTTAPPPEPRLSRLEQR